MIKIEKFCFTFVSSMKLFQYYITDDLFQ